MFYKNNLYKFRLFQRYCTGRCAKYLQQNFVFIENDNDIFGIDLVPYEYVTEPNVTGQIVRFVKTSAPSASENFYLGIIANTLSVRPEIYSIPSFHEAMNAVAAGDFDILLGSLVGFSQLHTLAISHEEGSFVWIKNQQYISSPFFFLYSFTWNLWLCFFSALLLCLFFNWALNKILIKFSLNKWPSLNSFDLVSLLFEQNSFSSSDQLFSLKIILMIFLGIMILFYGSFGAFLSALLTIKHTTLPFNDLDGLLQQRGYVVCTWPPATLDRFIPNYPRGNYNISVKINDPMHCPVSNDLASLGNRQYYNSNYSCEYNNIAFIDGISGLSNMISICNLTMLHKTKYFRGYQSVLVYSGFRYKNQFNVLIIKLQTVGVLFYIRHHVLIGRFPENSQLEELTPIDFNHISFILGLFFAGLLIAVLIFVIEILFAIKYSSRRPTKFFEY